MNQEQYKFYKSQFELLNDPNFSGQNPPKDFYLGSAVFWDSIRKIKAAEISKEQKTPLLIIQGERDYQVQSKIEIPLWKEQLKERNNVDYRLYPKLNHFFTEGDGEISKPDEYYSPANIPEYVINDILCLGARQIAIKLATICFNKDFLSVIKIEIFLLGYMFLALFEKECFLFYDFYKIMDLSSK